MPPLTPGTPPLAGSDARYGAEAAAGGCQSLLAAFRAPDPAQHPPAGLPDAAAQPQAAAAAILCLREGGEPRAAAPGGHLPPGPATARMRPSPGCRRSCGACSV